MCMVFRRIISKWESHIEKWEHELVDYLDTRMKRWDIG